MNLKPFIINNLTTPHSEEELWRKANDGFHKPQSLRRTLRLLVEEGLIVKEGDKYVKLSKQTQMI